MTIKNRDELGVYLPHELRANMLRSRVVTSGIDSIATAKNRRVLSLFENNIGQIVTDSIVSVQYIGSRVKGYCKEESDLDLRIVSAEYRSHEEAYEIRASIEALLKPERVCCMQGQDGFFDANEVFTEVIPRTFDDFLKWTRKSKLWLLLHDGAYGDISQKLARVSMIACLYDDHGVDKVDSVIWPSIIEGYDTEYIHGGLSSEQFHKKIIERYDAVNIDELLWQIVYLYDTEVEQTLLSPYKKREDSPYFGYDSNVFLERVIAAVPQIFSEEFKKSRRWLFGVNFKPSDLLINDMRAIGVVSSNEVVASPLADVYMSSKELIAKALAQLDR